MIILNAVTPMYDAVRSGSSGIRTPRETEYDAFSRITRMMRQTGPRCTTPDAILAVHRNIELWTLLVTDLAQPGNALPDDLKAQLVSLAFFSIRHGHAAISGEVTNEALVDINLSIMKGLRGEVAA